MSHTTFWIACTRRVVPEVGPPVVHVEQRDVDDARVGRRNVAGPLDAREVDSPPVGAWVGHDVEADLWAVARAMLAIEGHGPPTG